MSGPRTQRPPYSLDEEGKKDADGMQAGMEVFDRADALGDGKR